jgi:hypothetical protein
MKAHRAVLVPLPLECDAKMKELSGRIMKCENCNFSTHRDFVPAMWGEVVAVEGTVVVQKTQGRYPYVVIYIRKGKEKLVKRDGATVSGLLVVESGRQ